MFKKTGHPLVFIIDELDRCRPTFAIELLERVKHIFDVPNVVFVLGINRDELSKSVQSIYGHIDADIYLRRFFDMEFMLPDADAETFCQHMFERFQLSEFFAHLSQNMRSRVHNEEYRYLYSFVSRLWAKVGLSLRDIDYCVRLVALLGRNLNPQQSMHPELIGVLIPLKIANSTLYRDFMRGNCTGSDVMNYIDERFGEEGSDRLMSSLLDYLEIALYRSDARLDPVNGSSPSLRQLQLLKSNEQLTAPHYLTQRTQSSDVQRIDRLLKESQLVHGSAVSSRSVAYLAELIDLHQNILRR